MRRATLVIILVVAVALVLYGLKFEAAQDLGPTGSRAHDYVHGIAGTINVRVDSEVAGLDTSRFADFVQRYTGKLAVIQFSVIDVAPQDCTSVGGVVVGDCTFSDSQVFSIESSTRSQYSFPPLWFALHVVVLNGHSSGDSGGLRVGGFTIGASAFAIFYPSIPSGYMPAAMSHEFGHLMGLMCLSYPAADDSKCDGSGHSTDSKSLMAAVLDTGSPYVQNLQLMPNEVYDLQNYV